MAAAEQRLGTRVEALGDMLSVLSRLTSEAGGLLDSLGASLDSLGTLTAPIHSRATALTVAQRNIAATKGEVDALLEHLDTPRRVAAALQAGPASDLAAFLEGLEALERSVAFLQRHSRLAAVGAALGYAQAVFNRALETCHADFTATLADATRTCAPQPSWIVEHLGDTLDEASRAALTLELVPREVLPKLQRMAAVALDAGYDKPRQGYIAARGRFLAAALRTVGPEPPPAAALASLAPDALERAVAGWGRRMRALELLALSEHRLAASIWPEAVGGEVFAQILTSQLQQLAQAGRDFIEACRAPEKVFAVLELHTYLRSALPALEFVLAGSPNHAAATAAAAGQRLSSDDAAADGAGNAAPAPLSPLCKAALQQLASLLATAQRAAAALFGEYEDAVGRDASRILPPDGTVHPRTAQVLSYVKRLLSYEDASGVLFGSDSDGGWGVEAAASAQSALAAAVSRLLARLLENLEARARGYRGEPALGALFMMNNVHYAQRTVEGSRAERLLGREWVERHKDGVEEWGARYHDITWGPVLGLLQVEAPADVSRLKQHLKDTFASFNSALERIYATQSAWTIPDTALRDAVRRVIKTDVLGPYQDFLRKYADVQFTSTPAKYIRYAASDVAAIVDDDLFETKVVPTSKLDLKQQKLSAIV
ncbi:hypothetical protein Rsub_13072 [Raphidocelis subcapitata]|uniref:Exocyst subunit Exo70 family protein n=1 Tax=Raphidocelis subcapitata TaxID=307507 RepID=A0A2V0PLB1_9CHLO|nr:hypothetical protein Rsub_13072 [Raphidocelis subcapitata]|eukprot:GBG00340.1 hypothetical protein Rsub_13072 [Raphidocelis subcapitata]